VPCVNVNVCSRAVANNVRFFKCTIKEKIIYPTSDKLILSSSLLCQDPVKLKLQIKCKAYRRKCNQRLVSLTNFNSELFFIHKNLPLYRRAITKLETLRWGRYYAKNQLRQLQLPNPKNAPKSATSGQ
jgi:hypothetical protein